MFSYDELVEAYHNGSKMGNYQGHSVYSASCEDLKRIGINDNDYYIIFDAEQRYLYQRGRYIAKVDSRGNLSWLDNPFTPEEVRCLVEDEDRQTRRAVRQAKEAEEERQRVAEMELPEMEVDMELIDFDMELENILMELGKMMDDTCVWGEI